MSDSKKILIIEDEPIIASDLKYYVETIGHQVVGKAFDSEKALDLIAIYQPDLILLDINIEGTKDGIELGEIIQKKHKIPFIYITSFSDSETLNRAKVTMPYGYIVKPFTEKDIISSIEMVLFRAENEIKYAQLNTEKINLLFTAPLTKKEFQVLEDIVKGLTNDEIAEKQFLSVNTIKTHIKNLYLKSDTKNRAALIAKVSHP